MSSFSELSLKYNINLALLNLQLRSYLGCSSKHAYLPLLAICLFIWVLPMIPFTLWVWAGSNLLVFYPEIVGLWLWLYLSICCVLNFMFTYLVYGLNWALCQFCYLLAFEGQLMIYNLSSFLMSVDNTQQCKHCVSVYIHLFYIFCTS